MSSNEEVEAFLAHHGVKGMHWGVRKARDTGSDHESGASSSSANKDSSSISEEEAKKKFMAVPSIHRNPAAAKKALADNEAKSAAKLNPPEAESLKKGLTAGQKRAIKIGLGVAVVGGLVALSVVEERKQQNLANDLFAQAGKSIDPGKFEKGIQLSKIETWGKSGYIQPSSYERGEFTLPAGHTFHRISKVAEEEFHPATYATTNIEDFNRYVVGFRSEKGTTDLQHITWQAKEPIKVPSLATSLQTMQEVLTKQYATATNKEKAVLDSYAHGGSHSSPENAVRLYQEISGGAWQDLTSIDFISALKAKGYGAVVDEMDSGVIGDKPLVVFAHEAMTSKVSVPLSEEHITTAEKNLVELTSRKFGDYGKSLATVATEGISKVATTGDQSLAASDSVEEFLAHHGVKGMRWGIRKSEPQRSSSGHALPPSKKNGYAGKGIVGRSVYKTTDKAFDHPFLALAAVGVSRSAYQHRGEIAGTAVLTGKVGAYLVKQAFAKDSPIENATALGRQVVQGFVVHG